MPKLPKCGNIDLTQWCQPWPLARIVLRHHDHGQWKNLWNQCLLLTVSQSLLEFGLGHCRSPDFLLQQAIVTLQLWNLLILCIQHGLQQVIATRQFLDQCQQTWLFRNRDMWWRSLPSAVCVAACLARANGWMSWTWGWGGSASSASAAACAL